MTHYFKNDPNLKHSRKQIVFRFLGVEYPFESDAGVFSKNHVDPGTTVLLKNIVESLDAKTFLDFGCGYGVVGCIIKNLFDHVQVIASDVNTRAIELTKTNAENLGLEIQTIHSDGFESMDIQVDCIGFNPPIKVGKVKMYDLLQQACDHLSPDGTLWVVIRKDQGAKSALTYLGELFTNVSVVDKHKGYWVLSCKKH
jgi:16S rRNA (guanine1207-N2)-methyltransferase